MNKQTSVEWLQEKLISIKLDIDKETNEQIARFIKEAKQMHKEEIVDAFVDSRILSITNNINSGEQYYQETYGGNNG
jgi:hypothetical protein